jgi:hypothetical protein
MALPESRLLDLSGLIEPKALPHLELSGSAKPRRRALGEPMSNESPRK